MGSVCLCNLLHYTVESLKSTILKLSRGLFHYVTAKRDPKWGSQKFAKKKNFMKRVHGQGFLLNKFFFWINQCGTTQEHVSGQLLHMQPFRQSFGDL